MPETTVTERDARHLERAIELAERARGHTSPNPLVGAVIVKGGRVIGEGFHAGAGEPHAERDGARRVRARTPPARRSTCRSSRAATTAARRPAPTRSSRPASPASWSPPTTRPTKAAGRGLGHPARRGHRGRRARRRASPHAAAPAQPAVPQARAHRPPARGLQVGDDARRQGRDRARGDSQWISGEASRARAHRWRAESDAVAVGIGTALADDPLLTARVEGVARQPRRVVFDSEARLPLDSQLVRSGARGAGDRRLLARGRRARPSQSLEAAGVEVIVASGANEAARVGVRARRARRARHPVAAARGRPAPGRRVPRGRRDRRGAHVHRADRSPAARSARTAIEGEGVETIADAVRAGSHRASSGIDDDVLITRARCKEW